MPVMSFNKPECQKQAGVVIQRAEAVKKSSGVVKNNFTCTKLLHYLHAGLPKMFQEVKPMDQSKSTSIQQFM